MTEQQRQAVAAIQETAARAYAVARNLHGHVEETRENYPLWSGARRIVSAQCRAQVYASLLHTAMRMAMDGAERASKETP